MSHPICMILLRRGEDEHVQDEVHALLFCIQTVIMSSKMYGAAQSARIAPVRHISDHCTMSLVFHVDDMSFNADWTLQTAHVCSFRGCGTNFVLKMEPRACWDLWRSLGRQYSDARPICSST
jgi:hypothetical protein